MSFLTDIWDTVSGAGHIKDAGRKMKKAAKANQKTSKELIARGDKLYEEQKGELKTNVLQPAVEAITSGGTNAQKALNVDQGRQEAIWNPALEMGNDAIGLMSGAFGETEESADAFMKRFENSPLYQAAYGPAMEEALRGVDRMQSARGMLGSGNFLSEIMKKASGIGGKFIGDYYGLLGGMLDRGDRARAGASDAYGRNAAMKATAYGQTGRDTAGVYGDYGRNFLGSGNTYSNNTNTGYNSLMGQRTAQGAAGAASSMGLANTIQGFWSGAADLAGQLLGSGSGGSSNGAPAWQNLLSSIPGNYK